MNLKFVEAFIWVARLKSITRGAEKLCLTQSAVSNRMTSDHARNVSMLPPASACPM